MKRYSSISQSQALTLPQDILEVCINPGISPEGVGDTTLRAVISPVYQRYYTKKVGYVSISTDFKEDTACVMCQQYLMSV